MLGVLGGVAVTVDGVDVPLRAQERQLLGVLLAERNRSVSTEVLIDRMWEGDPPKTAAKVVHVVVGRLRAVLADAAPDHPLTRTAAGYQLVAGQIDLDEYLTLVAEAETLAASDPALALERAEAAVAAWRGRPWGAQADDAWLQPTVAVYEERHRATEELWADLSLRCSGDRLPVDRFRAAVLESPLRERRWEQLMLALYRTGRQSEALRAFDEARTLLLDELGIDPGPELRRLQLAILQHDNTLRSPSTTDTASATSFVGRTRELAQLDEALAHSRVVTVIGLGGMGKTRLVREYMHLRMLDGARVHWSGLAGLSGTARVAEHLAAQIGVRDSAGAPLDSMAAALGLNAALLVVDGAENAPSEAAALVLGLVDRCPRLRVVVTSRVPLGMAGERTVGLDPLPLPAPDDPVLGTALELALDRLDIDSRSLDASTRARLSAVCRSAGGVPLLVEMLVHASVPSAAGGAAPTEAPRLHHDVVRSAITAALDEAGATAAALASAIAPLPGGVSEDLAAALLERSSADVGRDLRLLARVHLVDTRSGASSLRFRSLDPVREALRADLDAGQIATTMDHATRALHALLRALRPPGHPCVVALLDRVEDEADNLRAVLDHQLQFDPVAALELAAPACEFWPVRGHIVEGQTLLRRCLAASDVDGPPRWHGVFALARTTRTFAEVAELHDDIERAVNDSRAAQDEDLMLGTGLLYLVMAKGWRGDRAGAAALLDEARAIDRVSGTPWTTAQIEHLASLDRALDGDLAGARQGQRDFATRMEELNDPVSAAMGWYLAATMGDMAGLLDIRDDIDRSRAHAKGHGDVALLGQILRLEARLLARVGDPRTMAVFRAAVDELMAQGGIRAASLARLDLALLELDAGNAEAALDELESAAPALVQLDRPAASLALAALAAIAADGDDLDSARELASASIAVRGTDARGVAEEARADKFLASIEGERRSMDDHDVLELLRTVLPA